MSYQNINVFMKSLSTIVARVAFLAIPAVAGLASLNIQGQALPLATLSSEGVIQLPANAPVSEMYVFDVAALGFQNANEATEFMASKSGESYFIRVNTDKNEGYISLNRTGRTQWTVGQWNAELAVGGAQRPIKRN